MRKNLSWWLCAQFFVGGCFSAFVLGTNALGAEKKEKETGEAQSEFVIAEPVTYHNLTVFPVLARVDKNEDRFLTLDEGLKDGTVIVSETGAGRAARQAAARNRNSSTGRASAQRSVNQSKSKQGQRGRAAKARSAPPAEEESPDDEDDQNAFDVDGDVNCVLVTNNSDRPLYLMPGEIIVGGKQDRTLAQEVIVPPGKRDQPIHVYCVEHGRWSYAQASPDSDNAAEGAAASRKAKPGQFAKSIGALNKDARLKVQEGKGQGEVWDEVANVNRRSGAKSRSGAFTANYAQRDVVAKLAPFVKALQKPIADQPRVVGVVVAVNNKIEAADVFETTPLFRKLWPKLLKSHALDATSAGEDSNKTPCTLAQAESFLRDATHASAVETKSVAGLVTERRNTQGVASFSIREERTRVNVNSRPGAAAGMGGMGGGMMGGGVHTGAFAK